MMPFGDPLIVRAGLEETMGSLASRIQKRLEIKDEDFAKWQFRYVKGIMTSDADLIQPDDIVCERFGVHLENSNRSASDYLGLQHAITHTKRAANRSYHMNYGIKIQ